MSKFELSERRACALLSLSRSSKRYVAKEKPQRKDEKRMLKLVPNWPRAGYRQLWQLLRNEGFVVNPKRVYRLYKAHELTLPRRRKRKRTHHRVPIQLPLAPRKRWSMDFMSDQLASGRRIRVLNVMDDFTKELLASPVRFSFPGALVVRVLDRLVEQLGKPLSILTDNGPEFRSNILAKWTYKNGINHSFIDPGKPQQNGLVERLNGTMRRECLDMNYFYTLKHAQELTDDWRSKYNTKRPHSSLKGKPPALFFSEFLTIEKARLSS